MTYYETDAGARVFSAGALDFPAVLGTLAGQPDARQPLAPHARRRRPTPTAEPPTA